MVHTGTFSGDDGVCFVQVLIKVDGIESQVEFMSRWIRWKASAVVVKSLTWIVVTAYASG